MPSSRSLRTTAVAGAAAFVTLAVGGSADAVAPRATTTSPAKAAAGWLAQQFTDHYDYPGGTYFDGGTTADSIYALAAAGVGKRQIDASIAYFKKHVDDYTSVHDTSGKPGPYDGSIGKTAVAALVADADPTRFGGYNLLHALKQDQCTSASQPKNDKDYTTPVCPAPGAARNIYSSISESLAILAEARGAARYGASYAPDQAATDYFLSLQCPNGGFTSATDGSSPCTSDPDATGYAMMALQALGGQSAALDHAAHWLTSVRNSDGSWTAQHVHNVDSTGLAAAALRAHGVDISKSRAWLATQQVKTGPTVGAGATRGALKYQGHFDASSSIKATADGILGMVHGGSLATLSAASAAPDSPVLALAAPTVRSPHVVAGHTQTVTGTGFAAGETVAAVLAPATAPLAHAQADHNGSVTLSFTVPPTNVGKHAITFTGRRSGLASTASFTVTAAPVASVPTASSAPPLADTGRDAHQTNLEIALGVGLITAGAAFVLVGRRRPWRR
ncbi:MAG TPA: prenyltransferase/squalene oxidase repeat-containing protein [Jatrophihabitans sp.]|jgi:hypothetical protein